jgi:primosomal protein N' (replication factor Y)
VGGDRPRRPAPQGSRGDRLSDAPVERVDRVVPDVPAVDRAFDYSVPADLDRLIEVGTVVRVPLHGRRVRGWVVGADVTSEAPPDRLRPVMAAISAGPSREVVDLTSFAAWRWAGPRTAFLRPSSPPNIVAPGPAPEVDVAVFPQEPAPLDVPDQAVRLVVWPPAEARVALLPALVESEGSTIVVAPDPVEGDALATALREQGRHVVVVRGDVSAADRTLAWQEARRGACIVVGGRIAVLAPVPDLTGVVVLDDADEALAEERAPAWHARDLVVERARRLDARVTIVTPAPTVEATELARSATVHAPGRIAARGWPRLQVVDLRDEPPGTGLLAAPLGPALHHALDAGGRALCILNRRGRAHLLVCKACDEIATCARCEARLQEADIGLVCARCAAPAAVQCRSCGAGVFRKLRPGVTGLREAVAGLVPRHQVIAVDSASAPLPHFDVAVGTEALLHRVPRDAGKVRLVAFLDFDQELLAPRYRATEQALWLLVRAARLVGPRPDGGSVLVQTRLPGHEVLEAAAGGDVGRVVAAERARRRELGFPPFGGLAEVRGEPDAVEAACALLHDHLDVVGPSGGRALLRAPSVDVLCDVLASIDLGPARARGRLRVDVDPQRV